MKLKNINISAQLRWGLGIILVMMIGLSAFSWYQTSSIWNSSESLYEHPLRTRRAIGEISKSILSMRVSIRDFLLCEDPKVQQSLLNDIAVEEANVRSGMDALKLCYLGPREDIDALSAEFAKWVSIRAETIRMVSAGRIEEARLRHVPGGMAPTQAIKVLSALAQISDFAIKKADEFYVNARDAKNNLLTWMLLSIIGIILFAAFVVYLLIRGLGVPLREMIAVAERYQSGNLDARITYASKSEFGKLAGSFNRMADTIETELALNTQSANLSNIMLSEDEAHRFCNAMLGALLESTSSQLGAVYLLNKEKTEYHHFECIGMDVAHCKSFSVSYFEGEFGMSLKSKKINHIKAIPEDTPFVFSVVSGQFIPREIITIPIIAGEEIIAMISLATVTGFSKNSLRLINSTLNTLSARMESVLAYRKLTKFTKQLEIQNSELEAQRRELTSQASELTEQNAELEMQKKQLDEASKLKTSFLSNMSHELRTPLNSVIALSGVLNRHLEGKIPDEEFGYLDVIERNGKLLLSLINDVLDLSRIESGREEFEVSRFNIKTLIREVMDLMFPQANLKEIMLILNVPDDFPEITSDYGKCRHILQNLLSNAVKFTEGGRVDVSAVATKEGIQIMVNDTGIGISKEDIPVIFDEFRQADNSNSRKFGGTGLGLAIAKKYAEMLNGSISVESEIGKGSEFTLTLPYECGVMQTVVEPAVSATFKFDSTQSIEYANLEKRDKTILLVEDTEAVVIQMKDILQSQGYQIMVARNGNEALDLISKKVPDAMILDLMMPEVDGFEVLRSIREHQRTAQLPVIILTAKFISKEELKFLKHNGIHQLIQKGDINKEQLLEAVAGMMLHEPTVVKNYNKRLAPETEKGSAVVLVVEDNPDNMLTIKALLEGKCKVISATDGISGIAMAKEHKPHLILMDIALPGKNGIEALIEIRRDITLSRVPVVAVSASAMKGDKESFIALGFDSYVSKPIDHREFTEMLKEFNII